MTEAGYAECLDVIGGLVEEAAKHDAVFCVETYVNNVIGTIDATLRLFRDTSSPHLGLVMDPGALNYPLYLGLLAAQHPNMPVITEHVTEDEVPAAKQFVHGALVAAVV